MQSWQLLREDDKSVALQDYCSSKEGVWTSLDRFQVHLCCEALRVKLKSLQNDCREEIRIKIHILLKSVKWIAKPDVMSFGKTWE